MSFLRGGQNKGRRKRRARGEDTVESFLSMRSAGVFFFGRLANYSYSSAAASSMRVYIKVGATRYGSLHPGYAERKGSSSPASRPRIARANAHARIRAHARVHSLDALSVLLISRARTYVYTYIQSGECATVYETR